MWRVWMGHTVLALRWWHRIRCRWIEVRALHHWIVVTRVAVVMLPVRTLIIHVPVFGLVCFAFANRRSALGPMATIRSVFCSYCSSYLIRLAVCVINLSLAWFLAAPRIQIWGLIYTIFFLFVVLILATAYFLLCFRLSGWLYIPIPMIRIHHRRLINVIRIEFTLTHCLHMVTELTCNRWWPPILCPIIDICPLMVIMSILNIFCRHHVWGRLLSLYYSWCKLTSRGGRWLSSTPRIFGTVRCVGWLWFLELISLAPVVLRSFSTFTWVHYLTLYSF